MGPKPLEACNQWPIGTFSSSDNQKQKKVRIDYKYVLF